MTPAEVLRAAREQALRSALTEMLDAFGSYDAEANEDHYTAGVLARARVALAEPTP